MNREETKNAISVMQAWLDGAEVEYQGRNYREIPWATVSGDPLWTWRENDYRIKPALREFWINPEADDTDARIYEAFNPKDDDYIKVREVCNE